MAGKTIPPVADPAAEIPMASERFLEKYVESMERAGQKRQPFPIPQQTPWARKSCQ
jgi:hypothetical protein